MYTNTEHGLCYASVLEMVWHLLDWDISETHRETYTIKMTADGLVPNRHQAFDNHHAVSSATADYDNSRNYR